MYNHNLNDLQGNKNLNESRIEIRQTYLTCTIMGVRYVNRYTFITQHW